MESPMCIIPGEGPSYIAQHQQAAEAADRGPGSPPQAPCHSLLFTTVSDYQLHRELAPVHLAAECFSDLIATKGIGLVRCRFDPNLLTVEQCDALLAQVTQLYTGPLYEKWVVSLNRSPSSFDYAAFVAEYAAMQRRKDPQSSPALPFSLSS